MKAHRLLNIDRADVPKLRTLAPIFALSAAVTVVLASLSKALFLSQNPIHLLPWMFLGSAAITAAASIGYLEILERYRLERRAYGILMVVVVSLLGLRLAFAAAPRLGSLAILLWCPAAGSLVVMQTWNLATSTLPTRQGKRLFPMLAALTTAGAVAGGLTVQGSVAWVKAEDLLLLSVGLLVVVVLRVGPTAQELGGEGRAPTRRTASPVGTAERVREVRDNPLLAEMALLVFLLQGASLLVDYQFSAELQPRLDKEGIAGFLGTFYWTSNLVVLVLAVFATSRVVRVVGIGMTLAASGVVLAIGSLAYVLAATGGWITPFWAIAATAFAERVAQYAFTKPAMQMAYMPLQGKGGEAAKALIDGVVYRVATALVSVLLLVAAPSVANQFRLSPAAVVASVVVIYLGARFGPHYRRAIFEALEARRLDPKVTLLLRDGLGNAAATDLERQLHIDAPRRIVAALDVATELAIVLDPTRLKTLALHEDGRVMTRALAALARQQMLDEGLLSRVLAPDRAPGSLRAALHFLRDRATPNLAELAHPLVTHANSAVAAAACVVRIRAVGKSAIESFDGEVAEARRGASQGRRLTGMTRAGDFARELPALLGDANPGVRLEAIEQMGQLRLPYFHDPLIACLTRADTRRSAAAALASFGDSVLASVEGAFDDGSLGLPARIALVHVCESMSTSDAITLLVTQSQRSEHALRDHAVQALWRVAGEKGQVRASADRLEGLVKGELERLRNYVKVETIAAPPSKRAAMFMQELRAARIGCEKRVFRLLGMLYDREAMSRAQLHVRSTDARARSNAVELLEQHVTHPDLRAVVTLMERAHDGARRSMVAEQGNAADSLDGEPWLRRVWTWLEEKGEVEADWNDPLDRVLLLGRLSPFDGVSGEALLEVADAAARVELAPGEAVCEEGDDADGVYWALEGTLTTRLGAIATGQCVGLVSALDGGPRTVTTEAATDCVVVHISSSDFHDAVELNPRMMRNVITLLTERLRGPTP